MSDTTTTPKVSPAKPESYEDDNHWHLPRDDEQEYLAMCGEPWITLCGQRRPPARAARLWAPDATSCSMCCHEDGVL
jgi:hypothetical protein